MKISLLVTGQIRNRHSFELIERAILASHEIFESIVISAWTADLCRMRQSFPVIFGLANVFVAIWRIFNRIIKEIGYYRCYLFSVGIYKYLLTR